MDLETLFWLVVIVVYLIFQIRGAAKKQKQRRQTPTAPLPEADMEPRLPSQEPTLDDALREIRLALGMETREEAPPPAPTPMDLTRASESTMLEKVRPAPKPKPSQPRTRLQEFKPIPTRYADADFENQPTAFGSGPSIHREPATVRARPTRPIPPPALSKQAPEPIRSTPAAEGPSRLRRQLQDPRRARAAFVLSEVFGPPHALRKR